MNTEETLGQKIFKSVKNVLTAQAEVEQRKPTAVAAFLAELQPDIDKAELTAKHLDETSAIIRNLVNEYAKVQSGQIVEWMSEVRKLMDVPRQIREAIACAKGTGFNDLVTPPLKTEVDPFRYRRLLAQYRSRFKPGDVEGRMKSLLHMAAERVEQIRENGGGSAVQIDSLPKVEEFSAAFIDWFDAREPS